ncbi:hypothetical protein J3R83DRAFT_9759, partial [Lanmaoa asiatica]
LFQLEWEAEVVEYVNLISQKTWIHKDSGYVKLLPDISLLGPCFMPLSYLHLTRQPGNRIINPETQYLKPLTVIHLFYYPELVWCPWCCSSDDVLWEGWTGTSARDMHGISFEECCLGQQLRCNACKAVKPAKEGCDLSSNSQTESEKHKGDENGLTGYCFALMSHAYWSHWQRWEIP